MKLHKFIPEGLVKIFCKCLYGHKARFVPTGQGKMTLAEAVAMEFGPKIKRVADICCGTSFCSWVFKRLGFQTTSVDLRASAVLRATVLVCNNRTVLTPEDIKVLLTPILKPDGVFVRKYADVVGPKNARFLETLRVNIAKIADPMKRAIAASAAIWVFEKTRPIPHFHKSSKGGLCMPGRIKETDFADEWKKVATEILPRLLVDNGTECRAIRQDAIAAVRGLDVDAVYADFPYCCSFGSSSYEHSYKLLEEWTELLMGVDGSKIRSRSLGSSYGALPSIWGFLYASRHIPLVILSYNDASEVKPEQIASMAEKLGRKVSIKRFKVRLPTTDKDSPKSECNECLIVCRQKTAIVLPSLDTKAIEPKREHIWHPALRPALEAYPAPMVAFDPPLRMAELFGGLGSNRIAGETLGVKTVFSSEIDPVARMVYRIAHGEWPSGDITKIPSADIPDHDILTAGFPCQAFSIAGPQGGFDDERGQLYLEIVRILKAKRPAMFLLENVKNLISMDGGKILAVILKALKGAGYEVHYKVLKAAEYSIPQARERVFFVGFLKELGVYEFSFPKPTKILVPLKAVLETGAKTRRKITRTKRLRIRNIETALLKAKRNPFEPIRIGEFLGGSKGQRLFHPNGPSVTLTKFGGGQYSTENYLIDGNFRGLTTKECIRVQSLPETFHMPYEGRLADGVFGNSVPCLLVRAILVQMLEAYATAKGKHSSRNTQNDFGESVCA